MEILNAAIKIMETASTGWPTEDNWIQGCNARAFGMTTNPKNGDSWCMLGRLMWAAENVQLPNGDFTPAMDLIRNALFSELGVPTHNWNDDPLRTASEVATIYNRVWTRLVEMADD